MKIWRRGAVEVSLSEPDYAQLAEDAVRAIEVAALQVATKVQEHARDEWYARPGVTRRTGNTAKAISVELRSKGDKIRAVVFGGPVARGRKRRYQVNASYYVEPAGALRVKRQFVQDRDEYLRLVTLWRKGQLPLEYEVWKVDVENNMPRGLTKVTRDPGPGGKTNWSVFVNQDGKKIAQRSADIIEQALQRAANRFSRS